MFDSLIKSGSGSKGDTSTTALEALKSQHAALDILDSQKSLEERLAKINANSSMDITRVMAMVGDLGSDITIDANIYEDLKNVLGNVPNPIGAVKMFSGMIAKRVLNIANVRKSVSAVFAQKGGLPLNITSNQVFVQPLHLFTNAGAIEPIQFTQEPASNAFDANGVITNALGVFSEYDTSLKGSSITGPFACHLFLIKRYDTQKGDSKFFVTSDAGYTAGIQLTNDSALCIMLSHSQGINLTESFKTSDLGGGKLGVEFNFASAAANQYYEVDFTTKNDVVVTGTNASVTHYLLPLYTPISEAIIATLFTGRTDMLATWVLNNLAGRYAVN